MTNKFKKYIYLPLLIVVFLITAIPPVEAATCKTILGKQVCLLKIKRSAKYYWEYRVQLKINNKKQPTRIYNCRYSYYLQPDKTKVYFKENDELGQLVCRLYGN